MANIDHQRQPASEIDPDVPADRKRFIPLENNPEVMNTLIYKLGLSRSLGFHDVFSIDDPDLLAFVPRPASALLLVFPVSIIYERYRKDEDADRPLYEGKGPEEPVVWYRQTIGNACGLICLLHAVSNGPAKEFIEPGSDLAELVRESVPLAPTERADLLYHSAALENAHQSAAAQGQTEAPAAEDNVDLHYVCFVKDQKTNHLWELDGRRKGPLDRGVLDPEDDILSEKALDLSVRKFIQREQSAAGGEGNRYDNSFLAFTERLVATLIMSASLRTFMLGKFHVSKHHPAHCMHAIMNDKIDICKSSEELHEDLSAKDWWMDDSYSHRSAK